MAAGEGGDSGAERDARVSVVIATRDRPEDLARTLARLAALRPVPPVIVVDNASRGDHAWVRAHPAVNQLVRLPRNVGAYARTIGTGYARTPYVAFSDDDSWWAADALGLAADALDRHPRLGLVAARILVGPQHRLDPISRVMADSPLPDVEGLPGRPVLGCLACAAVVRREAFLAVGGFHKLIFLRGEETLLCYDLAAAGWGIRFLERVVAHHHPSPSRSAAWRQRAQQRRNDLLIHWMRRPLRSATVETARLAREAVTDRAGRAALGGMLRRLPGALAARRPLPSHVENHARLLEHAGSA